MKGINLRRERFRRVLHAALKKANEELWGTDGNPKTPLVLSTETKVVGEMLKQKNLDWL